MIDQIWTMYDDNDSGTIDRKEFSQMIIDTCGSFEDHGYGKATIDTAFDEITGFTYDLDP